MSDLPSTLLWLATLLGSARLARAQESSAPEGAQAHPLVEVELDSGRVRGVLLEEASGQRVFRGIPYAAPPVGTLRWRPPQPVEAWRGVLEADQFGAACPQSPLIAVLSGEPMPETDEDCLFVNVWTAAASAEARLPVLVWIHGGGFVGGWAHQKTCDGRALAARGVIFVSFNYRLGPLGFFAHPELSAEAGDDRSGNQGLLDQLAALAWVQRNIAAFGGDPARVTIFGESAGGTSVMALLASPLAGGLFRAAIAQSPWLTGDNCAPLRAPNDASAEARGNSLARLLLGSAHEGPALPALRATPADRLWQQLGPAFQPALTIDAHFLTDFPERIFLTGEQLDVPLIVGTTADEGTAFTELLPWKSIAAFEQGMDALYGPAAAEMLELYPVFEDGDARREVARLITDAWFRLPVWAMLAGAAQVESRAWQYEFNVASRSAPLLGAHHAIEIPFLFGTLQGATPAERELAEQMQAAWVRFAEHGDPNGESLPSWPANETEGQPYLELGLRAGLGRALAHESLARHALRLAEQRAAALVQR